MGREPLPASRPVDEVAVMAAVDDDGTDRRLVIAHVDRDESWLSAPLDTAAELVEWR